MTTRNPRRGEAARRRRLPWALVGFAAGGLALWMGYASAPAPTAAPRSPIARSAPPLPRAPGAPPAAAPGPAAEPTPRSPAREPRLLVTRYHPRPSTEWQGMAVDLSVMPRCAEVGDCPMALACDVARKRCGPCGSDLDCAGGEVCVLDRCVLRARAGCRGAAECPSKELCVLSDLGRSGRGNDELRASCQGTGSGTAQPHVEYPAEAFVGADTPSRQLVSRLVDETSTEAPKPLEESPLPPEAQ